MNWFTRLPTIFPAALGLLSFEVLSSCDCEIDVLSLTRIVTMSPTPFARLSANIPRSVFVSLVHREAPCISAVLSRSAAVDVKIMVRFIGILEGNLNGIRGTDPGAEILATLQIPDG